MVASRRSNLPATWRIYRVEVKRGHKYQQNLNSNYSTDLTTNSNHGTPRMRNGQSAANYNPNGISLEKTSWRKIHCCDDLNANQCTAIRMIRVIKFHVAKRKFRQAHKPYDFKDIMDENAQGNMKVMYTLADIQRRLDQTLGLPKAYPINLSDKDREPLTLNAKVQRLEIKLVGLERQTARVISLLEELCHRSTNEGTNPLPRRISVVAEEST